MEHVELVVKIPEEAYKLLKNEGVDWLGAEHILNAVANSTPLPKGHGDLIDRNALKESEQTWSCDYEPDGFSHVVEMRDIDNADTIVKADMRE